MLLVHILSFTFCALLYSPAPAKHDIKLSVCEIVYQSDKETFDLTFYVFQDDLKSALYGRPDATQLKPEEVSNYIYKRFEWQVNQKKQEMRFHSLRDKNDQVAVQFSSSKIPLKAITGMSVKNTLLMEQFKEQTNMVYVILPQQSKKVQMLTTAKSEGQFSF